MLEFFEIDECISPPLSPALGWLVQHVDGRRKVKWLKIMLVQHLNGRRKGKWFKIMSVQHLDGRRKEKMVENHVSPTSRSHEEGKNGSKSCQFMEIMLFQHLLAGRKVN